MKQAFFAHDSRELLPASLRRFGNVAEFSLLFVAILCLGLIHAVAGDEAQTGPVGEKSDALDFYASRQYHLARRAAKKKLTEGKASQKTKDRAMLALALCKVFDLKNQELPEGLNELQAIYSAKEIAPELRLQAGLSLARSGQALQMRGGLYPQAERIDYAAIYREIMRDYPNTPEACFAIIYLAQSMFASGDADDRNLAFSEVGTFLNNYRGDDSCLAAVHLFLANQHIIQNSNYAEAAKQLRLAEASGIANPSTHEEVCFQIARIYDLKLGERENAARHYREFLGKFPNSGNAPVVERYLRELNQPAAGEISSHDAK